MFHKCCKSMFQMFLLLLALCCIHVVSVLCCSARGEPGVGGQGTLRAGRPTDGGAGCRWTEVLGAGRRGAAGRGMLGPGGVLVLNRSSWLPVGRLRGELERERERRGSEEGPTGIKAGRSALVVGAKTDGSGLRARLDARVRALARTYKL